MKNEIRRGKESSENFIERNDEWITGCVVFMFLTQVLHYGLNLKQVPFLMLKYITSRMFHSHRDIWANNTNGLMAFSSPTLCFCLVMFWKKSKIHDISENYHMMYENFSIYGKVFRRLPFICLIPAWRWLHFITSSYEIPPISQNILEL